MNLMGFLDRIDIPSYKTVQNAHTFLMEWIFYKTTYLTNTYTNKKNN